MGDTTITVKVSGRFEKIDLREASDQQLRELLAALSIKRQNTKNQLEMVKDGTRVAGDEDWKRRAKRVLENVGRQMLAVQDELRVRNEEARKQRAKSFDRAFVDVAKHVLDDETFYHIAGLARVAIKED